MRDNGVLLVVAATLLPGTRLCAQSPLSVEYGDWLRVVHDCPDPSVAQRTERRLGCETHIGALHAINEDNLFLTISPQRTPLVLPLESVHSLEVRRRVSRGSRVRNGALLGGGLLGTLGLIFGIAATGECEGLSFSPCGASVGEVLLVTGAMGGIGAGVGALIGLVVPREHHWVLIAPDRIGDGFAARRYGVVKLGVTIRF